MVQVKLINARKSKKFSQHDIAEHLNISQTQYLRKEKGEIGMNEEEWQRIAKLLDVEVEDIRDDDNSAQVNQNFESITDSNYIGSNNVYCNIPEHILDNQKDYIELLKQKIKDLETRIDDLEKQ